MQVVKKCLDLGAQKALYIAADMAEMADAERVVEFAKEQLHELDYVVLNHIGPSPYGMWDADVDHVQWLMQVTQSGGELQHKKAKCTLHNSYDLWLFYTTQLGSLVVSYFIVVIWYFIHLSQISSFTWDYLYWSPNNS